MRIKRCCLTLAPFIMAAANATVVGTTGTVALETSPYPPASDTTIYVFDEQQDIAFVASQSLNFGVIFAGTRVNSHYVQYDPASPTGLVGAGTMTFAGPILGVVTSTGFLDQDLSADGVGTSDSYFGLADTLGPYPTGADASARGLGSPEDDLVIVVGSNTLTIDSLEIPPLANGNVDGFRVFTAFLGSLDQDGDGVDDIVDNCQLVANADQRDTDGDNIGNACDPDIAPVPNDCTVNFLDLNAVKAAFFSTPASPAWNPDADFNGDDIVSFLDLLIVKTSFFGVPGPSGLPNLCD